MNRRGFTKSILGFLAASFALPKFLRGSQPLSEPKYRSKFIFSVWGNTTDGSWVRYETEVWMDDKGFIRLPLPTDFVAGRTVITTEPAPHSIGSI